MRVLFVVNPYAGRGEIRARLLDVVQLLTRAGHTVTVHPTSGPGEILTLLARVGQDYDMVLASGGDGTLNETISGLMELTQRPLLAYIPAGTVNDTATNLRLPRNILQAAEVAVSGREFRCDVASFNERWFLYVAAFGIFTDVAYATPQQQKHSLGRLAYFLQGVRSLSDIRVYRVHVTTPEQEFEDDVIFGMVASTTSVGGFRSLGKELRRYVRLDDGLSEVVLVKNPKNLAEFNAMAGALLRMDLRAPYFYFLQTSEVLLEFRQPVPWTLDGEYGGTVREAHIVNHQGALRFQAPPELTAEAESLPEPPADTPPESEA